MQSLVILIMDSFYGVQIRRDNNDSYKCKSELWMQIEYEEIVLDDWNYQT